MSFIEGKKILVTGGAGSIGSLLVQELLEHEPKVVRVLDSDETRLFELKLKIGEREDIRFLLGDVRDKDRLRYAVEDIDLVFHAAALKHVEECEYNPFEAVKTNVLGTQNVIDVAIQEEVEKVIFTSSDKAVNPTNVMGATKLLCERLITAANYYKGARRSVFSSVRFGNVVGSSGSVIPVFLEQIKKGGPVTITDPAMTRFVMSSKRAIELLIRATEMAKGGEIFIFKMPVVNISDLATTMIEKFAEKYGHDPQKIKTKIIGRKPGEKLYEELMTEGEAERALETEDMFIVLPEIKEIRANFEYPKAKKAEVKPYRSCDIKPMTKKEIEKMLEELLPEA
ncbi:MAG: SDR family NAD(P)-dependent oxidoreductase [Candidatus Hadarchaeales archaeon]